MIGGCAESDTFVDTPVESPNIVGAPLLQELGTNYSII